MKSAAPGASLSLSLCPNLDEGSLCSFHLLKMSRLCSPQGGNHFDQFEEGQLEVEQASLDKPIESVRLRLSCGTIRPAVRVDVWSREDSEPQPILFIYFISFL